MRTGQDGLVVPAIIKEPLKGSFLFLNDSALLACLGFAPLINDSVNKVQVRDRYILAKS